MVSFNEEILLFLQKSNFNQNYKNTMKTPHNYPVSLEQNDYPLFEVSFNWDAMIRRSNFEENTH